TRLMPDQVMSIGKLEIAGALERVEVLLKGVQTDAGNDTYVAYDDPTTPNNDRVFIENPTLTVTGRNFLSGERVEILAWPGAEDRGWFHLNVRTSAGARVSRTVDVVASGYGSGYLEPTSYPIFV
ncbi:MAG: hypothetical protein IH614_14545, partial [Desulfuromonadales bacterium]|nr:hypothetical protein [Desulfuromonadales bacterium]